MANGDITGVQLNYEGIREIMKSPEMFAYLEAAGGKVKEAVEASHVLVRRGKDRVPVEVNLTVTRDHDRCRAYIAIRDPAGLAIEAKYQTLTRAIDAAGGA